MVAKNAHLNLLAVRPQYQRGGIGRRLIAWLRESCLVAGVAVIYCELRASNANGRSFYKAFGFEETGTVPRYYFGVEAALCMALRLRAETRAS